VGAAHLARGFVEFLTHSRGFSTSPRDRRTSAAARFAGVVAVVALAAVAGHGFLNARVARLDDEAREVGQRMQLHRDLARAVQEVGGAAAVRRLGWATTNRALQTRLAWELGVPMELTESLTDYRVVFRSSSEPLVGRVYMTGRAAQRQTLARVGSFRVYRREGITFPVVQHERHEWRASEGPFTGLLQGIHTSMDRGRIPTPRVVTR
jgi:hypothetical protein